VTQTRTKDWDSIGTPAPSAYRSLPIAGALSKDTKVGIAHKPANLASAKFESATANTADSAQEVIWRASALATPASSLAPNSQGVKDAVQSAKGVVLHVSDQSVQCEFLHDPRPTVVWLPRSLFPTETKAGFTFSLGLETDNGYLAPKVISRSPNPDPSLVSRVSALLDQIES
jgi:hypothetical protein